MIRRRAVPLAICAIVLLLAGVVAFVPNGAAVLGAIMVAALCLLGLAVLVFVAMVLR